MEFTPLSADCTQFFYPHAPTGEAVLSRASPVPIEDALFRSLNDKGEVDLAFIASLCDMNEKEVINNLGPAIYQNPAKWDEKPYEGWETAADYLSGFMVDKLRDAQKAVEKFGKRFQRNVDAINSVLPNINEAVNMVILPGHPAVRPDDVKAFLLEIADKKKDPRYVNDNDIVRIDPLSATWKIQTRLFWDVRRYSTLHASFAEIFEKLLNGTEIRIDRYRNGKKILDQAETLDANEKAVQLVRMFSEWIWKDPERKAYYSNWQYEHFGCVRKRQFNGDYLSFPGMNPEVKLRPYQKDAVARILFSDNCLLAHSVGAGKTYTMIAAGMELRRLGKSRKNLYVVPNALTCQWSELFHTMYPQADVLTVEPKTFLPKVRQKVLQRIRDEDFDGVIMASSCFDQVSLSLEYYKHQLQAELEAIGNARAHPNANKGVLDRKEHAIKKKIKDAMLETTEKNTVFFDQLGITTVFLDESHLYKNVPIKCSTNAAGINANGSKKCASMLEKLHCVQRKTGGRGVVFATATPVTNSIVDIYVMQLFLQSGALKLANLSSFDAWIHMFAQKSSDYEVDVRGKIKVVSRFTSIRNLRELSKMLSEVVDYYEKKEYNVPERNYHNIIIQKSRELQEILDALSERADAIHRGEVPAFIDNFLRIAMEARLAALDARLLNEQIDVSEECKVSRCAKEVVRIYRETMEQKGTQIIFCDTSTPKKSFNIYDEMRRLLEVEGIPSHDIAFIHDADTDVRRSLLFDAMNKGNIRVLIGSTAKAGLGLNVQTRLKALHHLDIPWRPADMVQREGRIVRTGNQNKQIDIFRYSVQDSFDIFSYQLLENKQKLISQLLSGLAEGEAEEGLDEPVLTYSQIKALCVGDSTIRDLLEARNELRKFTMLRQQSRRNLEKLRYELDVVLSREEEQANERRRNCRDDAFFVSSSTRRGPSSDVDSAGYVPDKLERKRLRNQLVEAVRKNAFREEERVLTKYRGFTLILPAEMDPRNAYMILTREGRHIVPMNAESGLGSLARIDKAIDNLEEELSKIDILLENIVFRRNQVKAAMRQLPDYSEEIGFYTELLNEYHQKLGGNN